MIHPIDMPSFCEWLEKTCEGSQQSRQLDFIEFLHLMRHWVKNHDRTCHDPHTVMKRYHGEIGKIFAEGPTFDVFFFLNG